MPPLPPDAAALESIATGLEQLTDRLVAIADVHRADPDDELTAPLDDVERALRSTARRLDRVIRGLGS